MLAFAQDNPQNLKNEFAYLQMSDFDWNDQWVYAVGFQVEPKKNLFLRAGFNYAKNPVDDHDGFVGAFGAEGPLDVVNVQGAPFPRYYYETFRIIGFPAIVEKHLTLGAGYRFTERFSMNLGYMHAFDVLQLLVLVITVEIVEDDDCRRLLVRRRFAARQVGFGHTE